MKRPLIALCAALLIAGVTAMPVAGGATRQTSPAMTGGRPACALVVNAPNGRVNLMATAKVLDTTGGTRVAITFTLLQGATVKGTWAMPSITTDGGGAVEVHHNWRDVTAGTYTVRAAIVRYGTVTPVCALPDVTGVAVSRR